MDLATQIESLLFFRSEPTTIKVLANLLSCSPVEIDQAVKILESRLIDRGIKLIIKDDALMLGTDPEADELIEKITKEELARDIGKAGLETLAIVLYRGPVTKAEIDYVRGVNSGFILRNLSVRGLVERLPDPKDARRYQYRPTFDLLAHLGIKNISELPDWQDIKQEIDSFVNQDDNTDD
jgi:segregation and condensation protein B